MSDRKCNCGLDCPRRPNTATGQCDLHDAIAMAEEARDLLMKVLFSLGGIEREDREVEHCESPAGNSPGNPGAGNSTGSPCPNGLSECLICPRCGREMRSLEQIRAKLDLAPTLAEEVATRYSASEVEREFGRRGFLLNMLSEVSRDLACHDHACKEEPL
jgi:hypothetical protein